MRGEIVIFLFIGFMLFSISLMFLNLIPFASGQFYEEAIKGTTANVTVQGMVGAINVNCWPILFTNTSTPERPPGSLAVFPKLDECNKDYITIWLNDSTNVNWNLYINASDLVDDQGHHIPVSNIVVNSTCNGTVPSPSLISLDTSFKQICTDMARHNSTDVHFYLNTTPTGQYNNTYRANLMIFVNSSSAENTESWFGPNNITITIGKLIEIDWNSSTVPINFGSMLPGHSSTAQPNAGWPAKIYSTANTNIFIDLYINGTDLNCLDCSPTAENPTSFDSHQITYSNVSSLTYLHLLNNTLPPTSTYGDFGDWSMIPNQTEIESWWNITLPSVLESGVYGGEISAKGVDVGTAP